MKHENVYDSAVISNSHLNLKIQQGATLTSSDQDMTHSIWFVVQCVLFNGTMGSFNFCNVKDLSEDLEIHGCRSMRWMLSETQGCMQALIHNMVLDYTDFHLHFLYFIC